MNESLQFFEAKFYEQFSERCPMPEQELKQVYKDLKKEAMEMFDKSAVGDVKDQYFGQIKH